jgi:tetratricopeptide (TPR) repeat protein
MKRIILILILSVFIVPHSITAQTRSDNSDIDSMLIHGDYKKVIDTCKLILVIDSLNSEIWYKLGLAYQSQFWDDKSFDCFLRAFNITPDNDRYKYMVAKSYYIKGKPKLAQPLLLDLCAADSMNWTYAYYLTSIYMQDGKYDESIKIFKRFHEQDSSNYIFIDKMGLANLKKGEFPKAIELFSKSLKINKNNINAIKNIAFLYALTYRSDTAIQILTRGIEIDATDMDLYIRRAALNYSKNYTKKALDDYLKIINSGDSSVLFLKRTGIGYSNNFQPKEAIEFLLKAYKKDSSDYEVSSFLGLNYERIKDLGSSAYYYRHIVKTLNPVMQQLSLNYFLLAEVLKSDGKYNEAITAYLNGTQIRSDNNIYMIIANLYDEKLKNPAKAIYYYELVLKNYKNAQMHFGSDYTESIQKRIEFLKTNQKPAGQKTVIKNP